MNPLSIKQFGKTLSIGEDILQCIDVLLHTPKGSVALDPAFGCDAYKYLDMPFAASFPKIVKEITESIGLFEKRVVIESISSEQTDISGWVILVNYKTNVDGRNDQYKYITNAGA